MFYLERQNRKKEKMENENRKKSKIENTKKYQISNSIFSRGKTYVFPLETKSTIWKNDKKW